MHPCNDHRLCVSSRMASVLQQRMATTRVCGSRMGIHSHNRNHRTCLNLSTRTGVHTPNHNGSMHDSRVKIPTNPFQATGIPLLPLSMPISTGQGHWQPCQDLRSTIHPLAITIKPQQPPSGSNLTSRLRRAPLPKVESFPSVTTSEPCR